MEWNKQQIKEALEILSQLPDFDHLIFPEEWGRQFDIPITPAKLVSLKEYMKESRMAGLKGGEKLEVRAPAEGGVREVKEDVLEIKVYTASCTPEQPLGVSSELLHQATECISREQQENQESSPTMPALLCADEHSDHAAQDLCESNNQNSP